MTHTCVGHNVFTTVLLDVILEATTSRDGESSLVQYHEVTGNKRFQKLIGQSSEKYRAASCKEEQDKVVSNVVRMWRSLKPTGRFLAPTAAQSSPPTTVSLCMYYHDVGTHEAKLRIEKLLEDTQNRARIKYARDDFTTASTTSADSDSLPSQKRRKGNGVDDCFGGGLRTLILYFVSQKHENGVLNQFLP